MEGRYSLVIEKELSGTPEMIFDAWLDQENISKWLKPGEGVSVPNPQIDGRVGGKFSFTMQIGERELPHFGEYKKINRATELQFTWMSPQGTSGEDTLVTINLEPSGEGKTKLKLTHDFLPTEELRNNHNGGWTRIMECLKEYTEL